MKRVISGAAALLLIFILPLSARAAKLMPVGELVGLQLRTEAVTVAAFDDALGSGVRDAGLQIGDRIVEVNGNKIRDSCDVTKFLGTGETVKLRLIRGSKSVSLTVPLQQTEAGPKLGIYLRQGISGIGTVTWYDPETGRFGTLGHGVSDSEGLILPMVDGTAYAAEVASLRQGKSGAPGQLRGEAFREEVTGILYRNTPQGVFGKTQKGWEGDLLETASYEEVAPGAATIRSTVSSGGPQDYSVEILKIYPKDRPDGRNFLIRISDPELLNTTGGIIQGMSGSPIIQDGKLVGAVTHVLVNDPTRGYGIFIENMLDASS